MLNLIKTMKLFKHQEDALEVATAYKMCRKTPCFSYEERQWGLKLKEVM